MEVAMFQVSSPAPAPDGPIAYTLHPNQYAGRLEDVRQGVFAQLVGMERPSPPGCAPSWPATPTPRRCGSCWCASRAAAPS